MDPTLEKSGLDFPTSKDTVRKVYEVVKRFEATTEARKSFCTQHFALAMAVKYAIITSQKQNL